MFKQNPLKNVLQINCNKIFYYTYINLFFFEMCWHQEHEVEIQITQTKIKIWVTLFKVLIIVNLFCLLLTLELISDHCHETKGQNLLKISKFDAWSSILFSLSTNHI